MNNDNKNLNLLHYLALALFIMGWWQLFQLDLRGFGTILLSAGAGLLGCEYEDVKEKIKPPSNK